MDAEQKRIKFSFFYLQQNNIVFKYSSVVHQLEETLRMYKTTEIPPGNKPIDLRADPKYFDYTWTNWLDIVDPKTVDEILEEEERLNHSHSNSTSFFIPDLEL